MFKPAETFSDMPKSARNAYSRAKQSAKRHGLNLLSTEEFLAIWNRAGGKCELSRLPFSDELEQGEVVAHWVRKNRYPWQPSLDQIVPGQGYGALNCQLICKVVNIGKNGYQPETFERWVIATANQLESLS